MRFKDELQQQFYYRSQIDYSYWRIQYISNHSCEIQNPLEAMIDKATGFDKEKVKLKIDEVKYLVKVIIRCKKKIGYDTDRDKKFQTELNKLARKK